MLKIAIVTNNYKPYSGGLVSSIDSFAQQLRNFGHNVIIITLDFEGKKDSENEVFRINCPIRFKYKNNHIAIPWRAHESVLKLLKDFSPNIIHSQHPFLLGNSALIVSKKLNLPIIFTYHTQYDQYTHYVPLPDAILKPAVKNYALHYCNSVNGIVSPTESITNYLKENKVITKIETIPSGILPIFLPPKVELKEINTPFHLLTVCRFRKEKNIEFLLNAFSKLNQNSFIFTLIGYGSELEYLKNYAYKNLNLSEKNIKFLENPGKEIIASYYKSVDLFIFSSITETQGLVLAEAMAGCTPVIAVNAIGSRDIIIDGVNGFLVESIDEMVHKIQILQQNPNLHKKMQQNAWQTGQAYSSKNTTEKLINFYKSFL